MTSESTIDFPKDGLCPEIWEKGLDATGTKEVWKLTPEARQKISSVVQNVFPKADVVHITGSITSNQYLENGDVDVHFLLKKPVSEAEAEQLNLCIRERYSSIVFISNHPIEVYFQQNEFQDFMSVGCYDFFAQKWLVGPEFASPEFNPYSEYYKEVLSSSEKLTSQVRNRIFSIYEIAVALKKNIGTNMEKSIAAILESRISEAKALYEQIRNSRRAYSSPTSKVQALKWRTSRKWKVADAAFKLFDKYGYLAILKKLIEYYDLLLNGGLNAEVASGILAAVKQNIANVDKLSEEEIFGEEEQLDEGKTQSMLAMLATAFALSIPGQIDAKTLNAAREASGIKPTVIEQKAADLKAKISQINLAKKYGRFSALQSINILALTLFGEGRSEISNGGIEMIADTICNRTQSGTTDLPGVCLGRAKGRAYQYSFWNGNGEAISKIENGETVIPSSITNVIERKAWDKCVQMSIDIFAGTRKQTNHKINSYYVTDMPNPPSWAEDLTDVVTKGSHTFGYLKSNDPKYVDMTTMLPRKKLHKMDQTYIVKAGDTLSKIAARLKTTPEKIAALNKIKDKNKIAVGQELRYPKA